MKLSRLAPLALVGLFALTACGGSDQSNDIQQSESIDEQGSIHIVTTKIINVWVHKSESEDEGKIYKSIMENFNQAGIVAADGSRVQMTMEFLGTNIDTRISAALVTGGLPDILAVDSSEVAGRVHYDILKSIDDYVSAEEKSSYVDSVIDQGTIDGKLYTLSAMEAPGGLYYNKDMLKAVGYSDADFGTIENPWSWDDVHEAQKKLYAANQPYQINLHNGFGTDGDMYFYSPLIYSAGGDFGTDNHVKEALTSPEALAGLKELEPFYGTEGLGSNERWIYEGSNDLAFVQGQIPFSIYGPWDVTTIRNNYPQFANSYGIMPYPVYEDASGKKSGRVAIPCGSYAFGITRDCRDEKMDAAVAALLYLTGKEASEELYYGIGTYPTNKESLANIPELKEGPAKVLADSLNANEYTRPKQIKYPQLREAFGSILTYMKNRAYYGNDYDLDGYVAQQAQIVDNDQISN